MADRALAQLKGLTPLEVSRQMNAMYQGNVVTQVCESAQRITNVRIRYPDWHRFGRGRFDANSILNHWILMPEAPAGVNPAAPAGVNPAASAPTPAVPPLAGPARAVPLSALARLVRTHNPDEQWRENQQPVQLVTAELDETEAGLGSVVKDVRRMMQDLEQQGAVPAGCRWELGGHYLKQQEAFNSLLLVMIVAVILVFIMLAFQFQVRCSAAVDLPDATIVAGQRPVGPVADQYAAQRVQLHGCHLADRPRHEERHLARGIHTTTTSGRNGLRPALLLAGRTRFRPILMTSLAAILGLFPLALGIGPGAQMQQPLAIMVIGGLTANMLFTRMVIPVGYELLERLGGVRSQTEFGNERNEGSRQVEAKAVIRYPLPTGGSA